MNFHSSCVLLYRTYYIELEAIFALQVHLFLIKELYTWAGLCLKNGTYCCILLYMYIVHHAYGGESDGKAWAAMPCEKKKKKKKKKKFPRLLWYFYVIRSVCVPYGRLEGARFLTARLGKACNISCNLVIIALFKFKFAQIRILQE